MSVLALGCASRTHRFPLRDPMWKDADDKPFTGKPKESWSGLAWDAADQTIFRPISRFLAVDPGGEAVDVNAVDEVPDSSWFENRIARLAKSPEELAMGPCKDRAPLDPEGPWTILRSKPNGYNPGFVVRSAYGRKFLVKLETDQPERASTADALGSRLYWAAGFTTPCNTVVYMKPEILRIDPKATTEETGKKVALEPKHVREIFKRSRMEGDGTYRVSASLLLDGEPLGPWTYNDVRDDDPNDVVPHEDRRELRGSRVLASWINHFDSREENTLASWRATSNGQGWVQHDLLDWGDSLGSVWDWDALSRRIGHSYYLDFSDILRDFVTLGIPRRPWDKVHYGPTGDTLSYFDAENFDPEAWKPGYPNPAFGRMTERDAAWMARIIARIDDAALDAMIGQAKIRSGIYLSELRRILRARRIAILKRWLGRVSPLTDPIVVGSKLCLEDLIVTAKLDEAAKRGYVVRAFVGDQLDEVPMPDPTSFAVGHGHVCAKLPHVQSASKETARYLVVDVIGVSPSFSKRAPARVHLYDLGDGFKVVGLERPESETRPRP
ncbi:MAG: hypothetical protein ACXVEF_39965 [Polyangiales bacterium]